MRANTGMRWVVVVVRYVLALEVSVQRCGSWEWVRRMRKRMRMSVRIAVEDW